MADEKVKAAAQTEATSESENTQAQAENTEQSVKTEPTVAELQAKIKALESAQEKGKGAISAANADAAEWKRKYRATLDEAERTKQEQADKFIEMQAELLAYKEKERISTYTSKLIEAGYDADTAKSMALGLTADLPDTFFEAQRAFLANKEQTLKAQALNTQPNLTKGTPPASTDTAGEDAQMRKWFGL